MYTTMTPRMQSFVTPRQGEEGIPYSLYHYTDLAAGALPSLSTFFNVAVGTTDASGAVVTNEDTNMETPSQLSSPNRFWVNRICVPILLGSTNASPVSSSALTTAEVDDIGQLVKRGFFRF